MAESAIERQSTSLDVILGELDESQHTIDNLCSRVEKIRSRLLSDVPDKPKADVREIEAGMVGKIRNYLSCTNDRLSEMREHIIALEGTI